MSMRDESQDECVIWIQDTGDGLVKEMLRGRSKLRMHKSRCTIFRVPKDVINRLPAEDTAFYKPEGISLGLFHSPGRYAHAPTRGEPGRYAHAPTRGEKFKQKMAIAFLTSIYQTPHADRNKTSPSLSPSMNPDFARHFVDSKSSSESSVDQSAFREEVWAALRNVLNDVSKFKEYYDVDHEDDSSMNSESEDILQLALTLDAIVVGSLFWCLSHNDAVPRKKFPFSAIEDCAREGPRYSGIPTEDFLKLENQIPLKLAEEVLRVLKGGNGDEELNCACASFVKLFVEYLPGYDKANDLRIIDRLKEGKKFLDCDHLLDCVALVLREPKESAAEANEGLQGQPRSPEGWRMRLSGKMRRCLPRWCLRGRAFAATASSTTERESSTFNIPCATVLGKAGIRLRGCKRGPKSDLLPVFRPGWFTATLEVPRLPVLTAVTWTLWTNILVYEYERNRHRQKSQLKASNREESQIHAFLALMSCLVDTKEDVVLFTKGIGPILPQGYQSTPEVLANRFNKILNGLPFAEYLRWVLLADQINNYCKQKYRRNVLDFFRVNFGKPWLAASVIAATILLGLTLAQTTYAVLAYKKQ